MIVNQKVTGKAMSIPGGIGFSAVISMVITLALSWLVAALVIAGRVGESAIGYGSMVILLLSSYTGAVFAAIKIKHRRMMACLLSGVVYFLCLLTCTALFFGGQYQGVGVSSLLIAAGSITAALTGAARNSGPNKKGRRKIRSR